MFTTDPAGFNTTIGGFQFAANYLFNSSAHYVFAESVQSTPSLSGLSQRADSTSTLENSGGGNNAYGPSIVTNGTNTTSSWAAGWVFTGAFANQYQKDDGGWTDPMDDMLNTLRELAVRASLQAVSENSTIFNSAAQTVPFTGTSRHNMYITDNRYLIAAALLGFFGAFSVVPMFAGWSHLGREFSMSPLEVAKAFEAPLLKRVDGNATTREILVQVPKGLVRYGAVSDLKEGDHIGRGSLQLEARLAIDRASAVSSPTVGVLY
jgi:hypothetical protein